MSRRVRERYEYRINKKGSECFRTEIFQEAKDKLDELNAKRPVYTMQHRSIRLDEYNQKWTPWID